MQKVTRMIKIYSDHICLFIIESFSKLITLFYFLIDTSMGPDA